MSERYGYQRYERAVQTQTWQYYIPSGKLNGKTKAAVLLARVRNAMKNQFVFRLLRSALSDGTARKAVQNLSKCTSLTKFQDFIRPAGQTG